MISDNDLRKYALMGAQAEKGRLEALISELTNGGGAAGAGRGVNEAAPSTARRKPMSAAAKKRIGDATRKRWEAARKAKKASVKS